jgi:hypothetical protein
MRESKLVQRNFDTVGDEKSQFFDYMYGLFFVENIPLIVGHVLSKFDYFWSKITPRTKSKTEPCIKPHYAENCP